MSMTNNGAPQSTVMVVDDTPVNLKLLQILLQKEGLRTVAFPRGDAALKAAVKNPPDLILLDITMPEMNGFEVCERLKADDTLKDIPVIFISALSETADKVRAFRAGGVDYVTKPFQSEEVIARVSTHLALRRRERDLRESFDKLKKLEDLRESLVHMIVHDLRSPLSAITGIFQLLETEDLSEDGTLYVWEGRKSTKKLIEMVGIVLDVNKMEAGEMVLDRKTVDIKNLIVQAAESIKPLLGHRRFSITAPDFDAAVSCDPNLISRVVQNLLDNAIKYTQEDSGEIVVEMKPACAGVLVSVTNNGPGIPEKYHEKIFEKYGQAEAKQYSTGLGLTFCKMAVEAHGGRIWVDSDGEQGSTFRFELPPGTENDGA
jgi:signal transduction histidine kinase